jgi:hypothetical protein
MTMPWSRHEKLPRMVLMTALIAIDRPFTGTIKVGSNAFALLAEFESRSGNGSR